jgi:peptide methionine sulfoxide reductase msrA/msrB
MNKPLTPFEQRVLVHKGTEPPHTGLYTNLKASGTYHCKACDAPLYRSADKFDSHCGWPSFDDEVQGAVTRVPDADGRRTEIVCSRCKGHLGHVFLGEGFTQKDTRHCVNSVSLRFVADNVARTKEALFASGCFWGTEYFLARIPGVIKTSVGYAGGHLENPDYETVCTGSTGHVECVQVIYEPQKVSYETLCKLFFETHNFSQTDGQGPDIGSQYLSRIFCEDSEEESIARAVVTKLKDMGYDVATEIVGTAKFWPAEDYHQNYYERQGKTPYCHVYRNIFDRKK